MRWPTRARESRAQVRDDKVHAREVGLQAPTLPVRRCGPPCQGIDQGRGRRVRQAGRVLPRSASGPICHDARQMPWIGLLVAAWLVMFLVGGVIASRAIADVSPLTTGAWVVVVLAAGLLASAATTALAAARWRQDARRGVATEPASAVRRGLRLGNGYVMLAAAFVVAAVLLVLIYRLVHTV